MLFRCEDCGAKRFVTPRELNRAAKPRCHGCGSTRLEVQSDVAKEDLAALASIVASGGTRSMGGRADITGNRANREEDPLPSKVRIGTQL